MVSLRRFAFLPLRYRTSHQHRPFILLSGLTAFAIAQPPYHSSNRQFHQTCLEASAMNSQDVDTGYLDAKSAAALDEELMSSPGFTLEQLMELAGLSVAECAHTVLSEQQFSQTPEVLIICGPGNNGGDGLVAARHLNMFGYKSTIVYPKRSSRQPHYTNLLKQCEDLDIAILDSMPEDFASYPMIIDAIFGFSFVGEPREPFATILKQIQQAQQTPPEPKEEKPQTGPEKKKTKCTIVLAVDVPSGWHVNDGDVLGTGYVPDVLVSLTAPKLSAQNYPKRHFVGGRFLPPALAEKYQLRMPNYPGVAQVMEISRGGAKEESWEIGYAEFLKEKEAQIFAEENEARDPSSPDRNEQWRKDYDAYLLGFQAKQRQAAVVENRDESWRLEYAAYLAQKETNETEKSFESEYDQFEENDGVEKSLESEYEQVED